MFSLIAKFIDTFVQYFEEADEKDDPNFEQTTNKLPVFEENNLQSNSQVQNIQGKVTEVYNGQGLVNHKIYFSFENVTGDKKPVVGDQVNVTIKKTNKNCGYIAENVMIETQSLLKDQQKFCRSEVNNTHREKTQTSALIGKIVLMRKDFGRINNNVTFNIKDLSAKEYKLSVGDWVRADVDIHDDDNHTAYNVEPLRICVLEGEVTQISSTHGFINGEISFTFDVCLHAYKPKKWDSVEVTAIESEQKRCQWRAVRVVPRSKDYKKSTNGKISVSSGEKWRIPGQRPMFRNSPKHLPVKLQQYAVPNRLRNCVMDNEEVTFIAAELTQTLNINNYIQRFSTLLHLEEIKQEIDIREFDLFRVCLRPVGEYLGLAVPGLAEGRPSVLTGDKIILSDPSDPEAPVYEGYVHEVLGQEVLLKFNFEFHSRYNGEDFNVEFTFSRTGLRRCHQAVELAFKLLGNSFLFPLEIEKKPSQIKIEKRQNNMKVVPVETTFITNSEPEHKITKSTKYANVDSVNALLTKATTDIDSKILSYIEQNIPCDFMFVNPKLNVYQKLAVYKILIGQCRPLPYIIFGPPGTGKTITLVEAILQVLTRMPSSRIIACTPSNSAADLLIERLFLSKKVKVSDMVRLNSFHRKDESIPEIVAPFCSSGEDLSVISRYRLVVCTCNTAGSLYNLGLRVGHFTHAFVDEAGQATEPECLIPLGLVSGADGQIILAGDPKQLGPVLMSPYAKLYGLELSFLERVMEQPIYCRSDSLFEEFGGFNPDLVTMLKENYRSHKSILELPSRLFYFDQLQAKADPELINSLVNWTMLPTKGFPVIFHGIQGEDFREGNSPSWFNPAEVVLVVQYLQNLLKDTSLNIDVADVGIITPYRKQIEKIRLLLDRLGIENVKVGSVEEFQGQERQVVIISTVRSNNRLIGFDFRHVLGFLSNPKRFNVAITRAQAGLVIIGNPCVLSQDDYWNMLITYCIKNGGYNGCEFEPNTK